MADQSPSNQPSVLVDCRAGYRVVTLNRPARLNALTDDVYVGLRTAFAEAQADADCRALMLTGAGRGFCAGADLANRLPVDGQPRDLGRSLDTLLNPLIRQLRALPFPTIAAVNGVAAGAGANLALNCDIVLAARSARFIQAFAKIGLIPDAGGSWLLPRLVGAARARALALTAEPLAAETAQAWGLIWKVFDDAQLMPEAEALCAQLAAGPTLAFGLLKRALDAAETTDLDAQLDLERDLQRQAGFSPDYAEGVRAFMEKRAARFSGRQK
ncbi:MAG TPA: 2-(1,2-epoxy-1,2-dihydrophenyl)acetyl-CoA isomerase PaaG [Xanthobacteraceae bacterium]|nr:2-(1,2-epoxy-1,2-dihydrophenyl)acetyl-CoA isomerase PaaG [Xanthobacteraceae bacterium]